MNERRWGLDSLIHICLGSCLLTFKNHFPQSWSVQLEQSIMSVFSFFLIVLLIKKLYITHLMFCMHQSHATWYQLVSKLWLPSAMNVSVLNQLCVDRPPPHFRKSSRPSNMALTLQSGRLLAGISTCLLSDVNISWLFCSNWSSKEQKGDSYFDPWSTSTFREKLPFRIFWDEPRQKTSAWSFLPTSVLIDSGRMAKKCSWWSDLIRKESNCIISLSIGPV